MPCLQRLVLTLVALGPALPARVAEPAVEITDWQGRPAYRLSNGRLEAIVVPEMGGRILRFGEVGGDNWLWVGTEEQQAGEKTQFWGGDKTYFGPHSLWRFTMPATWPPPPPDGEPHAAEILPGGRLRVVSPVWATVGARIERVLGFDGQGDFVIEHRAEPVPGSRLPGALWTITQIPPTDAVYVPLAADSPYKQNAFWYGQATAEGAHAVSVAPDLLRVTPTEGTVWKLGAAPPHPALAAVRGKEVLLQRADPQPGPYPGGPDRGGFTVEVYHHNAPGPGQFTELEFLSPLKRFEEGMRLTTRWSLLTLDHPVDDHAIRPILGLPSTR
jgi:hypothetical protein